MAATEEVVLWKDQKEREFYESFAELYAIIKTTERLEKAYVKDIISAADYEPACLKLIAQVPGAVLSILLSCVRVLLLRPIQTMLSLDSWSAVVPPKPLLWLDTGRLPSSCSAYACSCSSGP